MGCYVITGGGTGGHLAVAKSLKEALIAQGDEVIFVGSTQGQDRSWFEDDQGWLAKVFLPTRGVVNQNFLGKILSLGKIFGGMITSLSLFRRYHVQGVVSVGGYSASSASMAALIARIPLFIHEQNGVTGRLNGMLKPYALGFFSSFDPQSVCRDYPVRLEFFSHARVRTTVKTVIFLGGSQGAQAINDLAIQLAPFLVQRGIKIIHQTGKNGYEKIVEIYQKMGIEAEVFPFDHTIVRRYEQADFAISRSGASALFELAANGLPTFFIPYPYAAMDHQMANARFLVDRGLAFVSRQDQIDPLSILAKLDENFEVVSQQLLNITHPNGGECMAKAIRAMVQKKG